uniref:Heat shock protein binding protein n=1 Tax=Solanum tuberosum TaxID=4113 RepID=M1DQK9_SOLTU
MKCNKDEDVTAREIVEQTLTEKNITRAQKYSLKPQNLFPDFDGISQFIEIINVNFAYQKKKTTGEMDFHGILSVESLADGETIKNITEDLLKLFIVKKNLHGVKLLTPEEAMSALNWEAFLKKSNFFIKTNACFVPDSVSTCSKVDKLGVQDSCPI